MLLRYPVQPIKYQSNDNQTLYFGGIRDAFYFGIL
jgi:hypothetical protein